ncbi:hypothetical protein WAI453_001960 [Rhynchosporium graminicola]|uniref:Uncharacterized protein n=1 Tax=Rhynchosporium graminicola TaxID=2792576 RepID=A0A1E1KKN1_9HELO|nr:uncharacterized protein RCO7_06355 [Rhynchosporium commune]
MDLLCTISQKSNTRQQDPPEYLFPNIWLRHLQGKRMLDCLAIIVSPIRQAPELKQTQELDNTVAFQAIRNWYEPGLNGPQAIDEEFAGGIGQIWVHTGVNQCF